MQVDDKRVTGGHQVGHDHTLVSTLACLLCYCPPAQARADSWAGRYLQGWPGAFYAPAALTLLWAPAWYKLAASRPRTGRARADSAQNPDTFVSMGQESSTHTFFSPFLPRTTQRQAVVAFSKKKAGGAGESPGKSANPTKAQSPPQSPPSASLPLSLTHLLARCHRPEDCPFVSVREREYIARHWDATTTTNTRLSFASRAVDWYGSPTEIDKREFFWQWCVELISRVFAWPRRALARCRATASGRGPRRALPRRCGAS